MALSQRNLKIKHVMSISRLRHRPKCIDQTKKETSDCERLGRIERQSRPGLRGAKVRTTLP
jgi:hypothetical protein